MEFNEEDEKIINGICLTMRHDYGMLDKDEEIKLHCRTQAEQIYINNVHKHIAERDEQIFKLIEINKIQHEKIGELRRGKKHQREELKKRDAEIERIKKELEVHRSNIREDESKDERIRRQLEIVISKKDGVIEYLEKKIIGMIHEQN